MCQSQWYLANNTPVLLFRKWSECFFHHCESKLLWFSFPSFGFIDEGRLNSFCLVCFHVLCFSKLSFSLLSQVFSFSSALLTAHELFGVSHRCIFFCHPLSTPKTLPQKAPKAPKETSALSVSTHLTLFFFFSLNFCVTCFQLSAIFFGDFCKIELLNKGFI